MSEKKGRFPLLQKVQWRVVGVVCLILLSGLLLWSNLSRSLQSVPAGSIRVYFAGEFRVGDGAWQPITEGGHIPATEGDVTLRGNFYARSPGGEELGLYSRGESLAFYTDHISLTFYEEGRPPYLADHENPLFGPSACGVDWTAHAFAPGGTEPIEILVHNPHRFGNETAIDELLSKVAIWGNMEFEKGVMEAGENQRNAGIFLMIVSLVFLGTALFSSLIHIKNSKIIWLLGGLVLFAGLYFTYSAEGVCFFSDSVVGNTTILLSAMMLYMLFACLMVVSFLKRTRRAGNVLALLLSVCDAVFFLLPILTDLFFYDVFCIWLLVQLLANLSLSLCLVFEILAIKDKTRWRYLGAFLPPVAFCVDAFCVWRGIFRAAYTSRYTFLALLLVATLMVLRLIPYSINAAAKAKELEMEKLVLNAALAESRISTMMSQIRPHFIYNTLGSIEQLCRLDPPKAGELVHNFAKYLRGNFGELDNPKPILMSQEMEHVHHYISIENVRFPDMTFTFEMQSQDFHIPALTVQPIVENAIKHGLMHLQKGGTIHVFSYETDSDFCISVVDDGVGFDTSTLCDDREHVGIRNIRERLKVMVNGRLEIESTVGVGTKVLIKIPKEGQK